MPLEFTKRSLTNEFRRVERDLRLVSDIDLKKFKAMTPRQLEAAIAQLKTAERRVISEESYGSWLSSDKFAESKMMVDALGILKEYKLDKLAGETLVPGYIYYRGVKQFGSLLEGQRCIVDQNHQPEWQKWSVESAVAKAIEVLQYGTEADFRNIYIEAADGRADALENITLNHITESSQGALKMIESYCDRRWDGPWAWELPSPYKLRNLIEDNRDMKKSAVAEMQDRFSTIIRQLNEGEMDKFEVVLAAKEMTKKIQGMIEDLGKLAGEGLLTLKDNSRTAFGDESTAQIDQIQEPINQAADILSQLRAAMEQVVSQLESGADAGIGAAAELGQAGVQVGGSPADAMGEPPMGDELGVSGAEDLADVPLDGETEERPMKDM